MQMDKLTTLVRNAVMAAQNDALARNHQKLTAMHVLTALLADDNVTLRSLVGRAGGDIAALQAGLDKALAAIPSVTGSGADQMQLDMDLARVMQAAETEARSLNDSFLAVDALLIAMVKSKGEIGKLARATLDISQRSYALRGVTITDRQYKVLKKKGVSYGKARFFVFSRANQSCRVCKTKIQRSTANSRRIYTCASCQPND